MTKKGFGGITVSDELLERIHILKKKMGYKWVPQVVEAAINSLEKDIENVDNPGATLRAIATKLDNKFVKLNIKRLDH